MPIVNAEAIVLKQYALSEADLISTLFTREYGKIRLVAKAARRMKSRFRGGLEPLSHVKIDFYERENRDLAYLSRCELEESYFDLQSHYAFQVAAAYMVEVVDAMLPERESNTRIFRLLLALLTGRRHGVGSLPLLAYFDFWMLRLSGLLPILSVCTLCGSGLETDGGVFSLEANRAYCLQCKKTGTRMSAAMIGLAGVFAKDPIEKVAAGGIYTLSTYAELNRVLEKMVVRAIDKPMKSIELLHQLKESELS